MARDGGAPATAVIAVPAYWGPAAVGALRGALRTSPALAPAASARRSSPTRRPRWPRWRSNPGLPAAGVVALCDFGGSGSSITLADAATGLTVGETVRFTGFSGEQVDQGLLDYVLDKGSGGRPRQRRRHRRSAAWPALHGRSAGWPRSGAVLGDHRDGPGRSTGLPGRCRAHQSRRGEHPRRAVLRFHRRIRRCVERNRIPVANLATDRGDRGRRGGDRCSGCPNSCGFRSSPSRVGRCRGRRCGDHRERGPATSATVVTDAPTGVTVAADAPTSMAPAAWAATDAVGRRNPLVHFPGAGVVLGATKPARSRSPTRGRTTR